MKVMHLISGGDSGGAKTHVHSLLKNLARTIDVTMVCFMEGPFAQEARELGIPTVVLPGHNLWKVRNTLKKMIVEGGYQILHCHGARGNLMGAMLRRATGLPVVTTVHSDYRLDYLGRPFSRLTYGTINTVALRKLDYRIGVSDAMTDLLISRGFDPDKLFTIYNGIDFTPRTPALSRAEYWKSVGLDADEDSVVVGIAARLNPVKDIATLIRGFALAHETCPNLRLLIAGDGEQMEMLKELSPHPIHRLYVIGGGARNEMLNRFTADATGIPVETGSPESTAIGNVMVQARHAGIVDSVRDMRRMIRSSLTDSRRYEPCDKAKWDAAYELYVKRTS